MCSSTFINPYSASSRDATRTCVVCASRFRGEQVRNLFYGNIPHSAADNTACYLFDRIINRGFFVCRHQQFRIGKLSCYKIKTVLGLIIFSGMSLIFECEILHTCIHHCLQFSAICLTDMMFAFIISETNSISYLYEVTVNYIQCNHQMQEIIDVNHV